MYNIIEKKKIWFTFSGVLVALSILALAIWGLRLGIDFTGGSLLEISYSQARPEINQIEDTLNELEIQSLRVQPSNETEYLLRFENVDETTHQQILEGLGNIEIEGVENNVLTENRFESIGPIIGSELKAKAIESIVIVLIFIVAYIAYAFRKVSKPVASWKYGISAIIALAHDILIVTGIFSVLGYLFNIEVDSLFVTALLTILGFSVHDTIVTFDRT
ncbi:protein translocase subunit SecF, partial [Candidatus Parcubacteria bacterium]